jgi:hypothetical protein
MSFMRTVAGSVALSAAVVCSAQNTERFSLTIYSTADPASFDPQEFALQQRMGGIPISQLPGYGIVRETRAIDLGMGINQVRFSDVASGIDPTTVSFKSLTAPDAVAVVEQNYEYDLIGADKLLEKYLDHDIIVIRKNDDRIMEINGRLLSYDSQTIVLMRENGVELIARNVDIAGIRLAQVSDGLITKPTLVWTVESGQEGKHDAQVTYQTDGLTWRADYNLVLNETDSAADIGAWVSIMNMSGLSYPEAGLKLVAGDVQRLAPPEPTYRRQPMQQMAAGKMDAGFEEKAFFEYHLYTLGRPTSLSNNSTKQIELFPQKAGVAVSKTFVYYGLPEQLRRYSPPSPNNDRDLGIEMNKKVDVYITLNNSEANGLGIPLPAGRVRVYKEDDADDSMEFIGEDIIQHTPKDEDVRIKLGSAFDIVGERTQTTFEMNAKDHWIVEKFSIKIKNHKKEPVAVIIKENLFRWSTWEIFDASDKYEKQDARTIHFPVEVPADGEKTVTYGVKYTW